MNGGIGMTKVVLVLSLSLGVWAISARADTGQAAPPHGETVAASGPAPCCTMVVRGDEIYWTTGAGDIRSAPKAGGVAKTVAGPGTNGLEMDERGLYYADAASVYLLPLTGRGAEAALISPLKKAMLVASDADDLYCVIPDFDDDPDRGVYRVDKRQGKAQLIWRTDPGDQAIVAIDGADVYLASWAKGVVYRFDKASGKRATFLRGQHHVVSIAVDPIFLYWYCEGTAEVRRTPKKRAGKIEVVGRQIDTEPVVAHATGVYWFEGGPGPTGYRLMRLVPGTAVAIPVAKDLNLPSGLTVDDSWVYTADVMRGLIVRLPQ